MNSAETQRSKVLFNLNLKYRNKGNQLKKKNVTGNAIPIKAKNCSKFHRRSSPNDSMFKLILQISSSKGKLVFLPTTFAVILLAMALPIFPKAKFSFEVIPFLFSNHSCFLKSRKLH